MSFVLFAEKPSCSSSRTVFDLLENTHDEAFAEVRRNRRKTNIDVFAGDFDLDTTVLRKAFFGDVELAHDFHARGDRGVGSSWAGG